MTNRERGRTGHEGTTTTLSYEVPPPDLQAAKRFLNALDEEADRFTFQYFPDPDPYDGEGKADKIHGSLRQHADRLTRLNQRGHGIFITVNETDFNGRDKENIQRIRAVFSDYDEEYGTLERIFECPLEPQLIVQTSPGNQHPYWFVDGLDLEEFKPIQKRIQERIGGDSVNAKNRVMRLPGFYHMKDPENPHLVEILEENPARPYTAEEVKTTFPPVDNNDRPQDGISGDSGDSTKEYNGEPFELPETIEEGSRNTTLTRYAGSIWTEEKTRLELLEDLKRVNQNRCKPPLPERELQMITHSAKGWEPVSKQQSTRAKIKELLEILPTLEWPDPGTDSDKAVLRSFLDIAENACSMTVAASSRDLSARSGYSKNTVLDALDRLQQYKFIKQTSDHDGPNAPGYRINPKRLHHYSNPCGRVRSTGEVLSGVSMDELQDTVYYPSALGRKARPIINALRDTGGVETIKELAELVDTTPRTVSNQLFGYDSDDTGTLTGKGIVEVEPEGSCKRVWLHDDWRENLKEYRRNAPSWLKDIDRKIKHREEQIIHAYEVQKREKGELKAVRIGGYGEVRAPSEVIDYLKLERKYRERLNNAEGKPKLDNETLNRLADLQGEFNDRVKRFANDLLDLIRERIEKQREKWGDK